jgi:hypothetical protein
MKAVGLIVAEALRLLRPRTLAGLAALAVLASAGPAAALCPNCLGQSPILSSTLRLVGAFLLVPPAVFFAVALAIRKLSRGR